MTRCRWVNLKDAAYVAYHDTEWGVPVHDDRMLFEMLVLESFVAGLSWRCVLHKRRSFRQAFNKFNPSTVAHYDEDKIIALKSNPALIRHEGKVRSAITNAKIFLEIQTEFNSFESYLWHWTEGNTIISKDGETKSVLSDSISKDLKKRGMKFMGSTTIFSYLSAVGVISAHQKECFLRKNTNHHK